jgi:hypothetical protein
MCLCLEIESKEVSGGAAFVLAVKAGRATSSAATTRRSSANAPPRAGAAQKAFRKLCVYVANPPSAVRRQRLPAGSGIL